MIKLKIIYNKLNVVGKSLFIILCLPLILILSLPVGLLSTVVILYKSLLKDDKKLNFVDSDELEYIKNDIEFTNKTLDLFKDIPDVRKESLCIDEINCYNNGKEIKHKPVILGYGIFNSNIAELINKHKRGDL